MKNKDILKLYLIFNKLKEQGDTLFKFWVIKNLSIVKFHAEPILESEKYVKSILLDFNKEKNSLIRLYGKKKDNTFYIDLMEDTTKYKEGLAELLKKYELEVSKYLQELSLYNDLLEEYIPNDLFFNKINIEKFKKIQVSGEDLEFLYGLNIIEECQTA